jgi:transcriptional regulator with XRE-family HTH domain
VPAGPQLKILRNKRNVTVREVEQASRRIAEAKGDKRFRISNGWLAQLENGSSEPSICKLFSLSAIYRATFRQLARLYNVDVDDTEQYESIASPHVTQLLPERRSVDSDVTSGVAADTSLVPELVTSSTTEVFEKTDEQHIIHARLGSNEDTMYPMIRPGALLKIDTRQNKLQPVSSHSEFERPIFFIELRQGYTCGWCELQGNQLLIIPHPSSPSTVHSFIYPREAEIVGRVIGYDTSCVDLEQRQSERRKVPRPQGAKKTTK